MIHTTEIKRTIIRNIEYRTLLEESIVSAILAILGIRLFLQIARFPSIGGIGLHISHMLWGGLLMFTALLLTLLFLNNEVKRVAAVIGGLGFGTFIDEIGKFITRDNNYFYKPTFMLIYIMFILLYLLLHVINRRREFTQKEYLINSIEFMKDAVIHDLDREEQRLAIEYLSHADKSDIITQTLSTLYKNLEVIERPKRSLWSQIQSTVKKFYISIINTLWFKRTLIIFFLAQAIVTLIIAILLLIERNTFVLPALLISHSFTQQSFNTWHLFSSLASIFCILIGVSLVYSSRLKALIWFKRSILITLLLTEVFAFYHNPLNAFVTFLFNILILTALNYMIESEQSLKKINEHIEA